MILNYSSYAGAITLGLSRKNMHKTARELLGVIIDNYTIVNTHGEPYAVEGREAAEWYRGETDIYDNIKKGADAPEVKKQAVKYFQQIILTNEFLLPTKLPAVLQKLIEIINSDAYIPKATKEELLSLSSIENSAEFLAKAFLYAVTVDNRLTDTGDPLPTAPAPSIDTLQNDINAAFDILGRLPKPVQLSPPEELQQDEMKYVSALLDAFSEDAKKPIPTSADIPKEYRRLFDRQRRAYYAAESVRESTRDSEYFRGRQDFAELKQEILDGVIETCDAPNQTGMERLRNTLDKAVFVPLTSLLPRIPGWVGANEKKGVCHMLVNDDEIRWTDGE